MYCYCIYLGDSQLKFTSAFCLISLIFCAIVLQLSGFTLVICVGSYFPVGLFSIQVYVARACDRI